MVAAAVAITTTTATATATTTTTPTATVTRRTPAVHTFLIVSGWWHGAWPMAD